MRFYPYLPNEIWIRPPGPRYLIRLISIARGDYRRSHERHFSVVIDVSKESFWMSDCIDTNRAPIMSWKLLQGWSARDWSVGFGATR
jgi:hypothetical protein